jgi:parvulin-like peptidyl-prolyl isomerase
MLTRFKIIGFSLLGVWACHPGVNQDQAVAVVNHSTISFSSFEQALQRMSLFPGKDLSRLDTRKELLKEMINQELLFQEAMKMRLLEKSDRLKQEVVKEYLKITIGDVSIPPTEEEIQKFFEQRRNQLEMVRASHILIKPEKLEDDRSQRQALQKAQNVLQILQREGTQKFSSLAQQYSQDEANKNSGGDLSFFTRDRMVPEFSEAAFALHRVGDVSKIIKTQFGYHIILLTDEKRGLEFFRSRLTQDWMLEKAKERMENHLATLRSQSSVKLFPEKLMNAKLSSTSEGKDHESSNEK